MLPRPSVLLCFLPCHKIFCFDYDDNFKQTTFFNFFCPFSDTYFFSKNVFFRCCGISLKAILLRRPWVAVSLGFTFVCATVFVLHFCARKKKNFLQSIKLSGHEASQASKTFIDTFDLIDDCEQKTIAQDDLTVDWLNGARSWSLTRWSFAGKNFIVG